MSLFVRYTYTQRHNTVQRQPRDIRFDELDLPVKKKNPAAHFLLVVCLVVDLKKK